MIPRGQQSKVHSFASLGVNIIHKIFEPLLIDAYQDARYSHRAFPDKQALCAIIIDKTIFNYLYPLLFRRIHLTVDDAFDPAPHKLLSFLGGNAMATRQIICFAHLATRMRPRSPMHSTLPTFLLENRASLDRFWECDLPRLQDLELVGSRSTLRIVPATRCLRSLQIPVTHETAAVVSQILKLNCATLERANFTVASYENGERLHAIYLDIGAVRLPALYELTLLGISLKDPPAIRDQIFPQLASLDLYSDCIPAWILLEAPALTDLTIVLKADECDPPMNRVLAMTIPKLPNLRMLRLSGDTWSLLSSVEMEDMLSKLPHGLEYLDLTDFGQAATAILRNLLKDWTWLPSLRDLEVLNLGSLSEDSDDDDEEVETDFMALRMDIGKNGDRRLVGVI